MSGEQLKEALMKRFPVVHRGINYAYISAIIYRVISGKIVVSVELMDNKASSVTIARANEVELKEEQENVAN